jgi:ribosome biogenesis GTPase
MTDHFDSEEDFHAKDRKQFRKERRQLQESDRSKFKKTNLVKKVETVISKDALRGRVVAVTGEGIWVDSAALRILCTLKGILKKEKMRAKNLIAVGDYVWFEPLGTSSGSIVDIEERRSMLARADVTGTKQQLIAVNIDQVFIVVSVVEPPLKPSLVDRYLIAAHKGNLQPIIVINKIDLLAVSEEETERYKEFLAAYEPLGVPILTLSSLEGNGLDAFKFLMKDRTSVVAGQSGVGKSTLLNAAFQFSRKTGDLTVKTFKGAHTTSTAELIALPGGGYCIDTPGVRSFGLWQLDREEVRHHFKEIANLGEHCHFGNCTHVFEPRCAVLEALKQGLVPLIRYESYCTLLDEALGGLDNRTKRKMETPDG